MVRGEVEWKCVEGGEVEGEVEKKVVEGGEVEGEVSLGQSNLAKWEMRCSSWPIGVCHVRGEVEKKLGEACRSLEKT